MAIATSGPGAINLVTGLATAMMDSVPMVAITGNVPRALLGKDAFQETDIVGIALPVTKFATVVMDPDEVPYAVAEAFEIARSGRPGPVLLDFPKDVLQEETRVAHPEPYELRLPGLLRPVRGDVPEADELAEMIGAAERPLILSGHGVQIAQRGRPAARGRGADRDPGGAHASRHRQHRRDASAQRRIRRHARLDARQQDDPAVRPAHRRWVPLRRPDHRQDEHLRAERQDRARRRRPVRDRQERADRPRHRRGCRRPPRRAAAPTATVGAADRVDGPARRLAGGQRGPLVAWLRRLARGPVERGLRGRPDRRGDGPPGDAGQRRRAEPDVGRALLRLPEAVPSPVERRPRDDGLQRPCRDGRRARGAGAGDLGDRRRWWIPDDDAGAGDPGAGPDPGADRGARTTTGSG